MTVPISLLTEEQAAVDLHSGHWRNAARTGAQGPELFPDLRGSPSSFPTSEGFCGLGDGKPSPLADAILRGPGADGKPGNRATEPAVRGEAA